MKHLKTRFRKKKSSKYSRKISKRKTKRVRKIKRKTKRSKKYIKKGGTPHHMRRTESWIGQHPFDATPKPPRNKTMSQYIQEHPGTPPQPPGLSLPSSRTGRIYDAIVGEQMPEGHYVPKE